MLYSVFTPTLDMLYLTRDIWHRHLTCYTWHVISDTDTRHVILDTWYQTPVLNMLYLTPDPWHLISDTDTWYVILDTWSWHLIHDTIHASTHLARFHIVQVHWPNIVAPDRILLPLIPVLCDIFMTITFMGTWYDYYIITRHLVLLNSCAPKLLYTWTPEKERLMILYSC